MADEEQIQGDLGISRRDLIRRAAIVGGTLIWAAPAVQTITAKAYAATSPIVSACCECNDFGPPHYWPCIADHFTCEFCVSFCTGHGGVKFYGRGSNCKCGTDTGCTKNLATCEQHTCP